jgi:hypothetical protein
MARSGDGRKIMKATYYKLPSFSIKEELMKDKLPERVIDLLNDLNSNSTPKILNAINELEKFEIHDYRIIYALQEFSANAGTIFLGNKADRLVEKLEALAGKPSDRSASELLDRELLEKIALEQLKNKGQLKSIYNLLLVAMFILIVILLKLSVQ